MSKKLELEHLPMNSDRKSQIKKSLKISETAASHWDNCTTLCISYRFMKWCKKKKKKQISQAQHKRNLSVATQPTNASIPAQWIAFHRTIQGYSLFYLAHLHPFSPGLLYPVDREKKGEIVHLLLLSSSWKSHIFLVLTFHLYKFLSSFPSLLLYFIICIFYFSATPHSLQDPSSPTRY